LFAAEMAAFFRQKTKKDLANFPGPSTVRWLHCAIVALQGLNLTTHWPTVNKETPIWWMISQASLLAAGPSAGTEKGNFELQRCEIPEA
jgi:hypothetical protein